MQRFFNQISFDRVIEAVAGGPDRNASDKASLDETVIRTAMQRRILSPGRNVTNQDELVVAEAQFRDEIEQRQPGQAQPRRPSIFAPSADVTVPVIVTRGHPERDKFQFEESLGPFSLGPLNDIAGQFEIRIAGLVVVVLGILQGGCGGGAFGFINWYKIDTAVTGYGYGAWWAAPLTIVAGTLAAVGQRKILIMYAIGFGMLSLIPLVVAAIWDGNASAFFFTMTACVGQTRSHAGDDAHVGECYGSQVLCNGIGVLCDEVKYADTWRLLGDDAFFKNRGECFCTDGNECYDFTLTKLTWSRGNYCGDVRLKLPSLLAASTGFAVAEIVAVVVLIVYCLFSLCCGRRLLPKPVRTYVPPPTQPYSRVRRDEGPGNYVPGYDIVEPSGVVRKI
jgi:hypothetical protein